MNGKNQKIIWTRRKSVSEVLTHPVLDFRNESGEGNGLRYGVASVQGYRNHMEDRYVAKTRVKSSNNNSNQLQSCYADASFFAVFDGHGGHWVSEHCANEKTGFLQFFGADKALAESLQKQSPFSDYRDCVKRLFLDYDRKIRREIDYQKNQGDSCGSTGLILLIFRKHVILANCGDSRGVIYVNYRDHRNRVTVDHSVANFLNTSEQSAEIKAERERLEGLRFEMTSDGGIRKPNDKRGHGLMLTRSFGDFDFKGDSLHNLLTSEPYVNHGGYLLYGCERVAVLSSDGLWDVFQSEDVCEFVVQQLPRRAGDICKVAKDVLYAALEAGSRDNMTVVIVVFSTSIDNNDRQLKNEFSVLSDNVHNLPSITDFNKECADLAAKMVTLSARNVFQCQPSDLNSSQSNIGAFNRVNFFFWQSESRKLLQKKFTQHLSSSSMQKMPTLSE